MSFYFAREPLTNALWDEAMPLLSAHWEEVAHYPDIPLDPDVERYRQLDAAGVIRCYTARDFGQIVAPHWQRVDLAAYYRLVGYALFIVNTNLHYRTSLQAVQDVLFVDKSVRGTSMVPRFLRFCDRELQLEGVQAVYHHLKASHDHAKLMRHMGYELVDQIYAKRLDDRSAWKDQADANFDESRWPILATGMDTE